MAGVEGEPHRGEPTPRQRRPTEHHKPKLEGGNGAPGIKPTLHEQAKPPPESREHKPQTRIVYNPKKETLEEYKKRYHEAHAQRDPEDREKLRKYNREYKRRWRKARREQREAALTQREQEQQHEATQIFPSPPKT